MTSILFIFCGEMKGALACYRCVRMHVWKSELEIRWWVCLGGGDRGKRDNIQNMNDKCTKESEGRRLRKSLSVFVHVYEAARRMISGKSTSVWLKGVSLVHYIPSQPGAAWGFHDMTTPVQVHWQGLWQEQTGRSIMAQISIGVSWWRHKVVF